MDNYLDVERRRLALLQRLDQATAHLESPRDIAASCVDGIFDEAVVELRHSGLGPREKLELLLADVRSRAILDLGGIIGDQVSRAEMLDAIVEELLADGKAEVEP
jgi:hypothetical protein